VRVSDKAADTGKVSWFSLLGFRQTWAFFFGKFLTDPVWWFYLFWLPAFLKAQYGIEGVSASLPVALVYTMSTVGSIFGGWLPMYFIKKDGRCIVPAKYQC
jgi:ACS family hexuronate transporter-like MFS transporter